MKRFWATLAVLALIGAISAGTTGATGTARAAAPASYTCSGGSSSNMSTIPAGTYTDVTVTGICHIFGAVTGPAVGSGGAEVITNCNAAGGAVNVLGDLTVAPNGVLDAGSCAPTVTVGGDVSVGSGGTLILGCSPNLVIMPPVPPFPTLCPGITTHNSIGGNVTADQALAVIFHTNMIKGNLSVHGGGGGANCNVDPNLSVALDSKLGPTPQLQAGTPAYTDFEDNSIGGNLRIIGMQGCWMGALRNTIPEDLQVAGNIMADSDANEVNQNTVDDDISCFDNIPDVQYGDSGATPNRVQGNAEGECGFNVLSPDPMLPPGVLQPISVKVGGDRDSNHS